LNIPKIDNCYYTLSYLAFPARVDWCGDSAHLSASNRRTKSEAERIVVRVSAIVKTIGGQKRFAEVVENFSRRDIIHSLRRASRAAIKLRLIVSINLTERSLVELSKIKKV
jgi:hypothetical protein